MKKNTLYVAPGQNQCNVYVMNYPMKAGQKPSDLNPKFQDKWKQVALLNASLNIVWIDPAVSHLKEDIEGQMGGTYFEIDPLVEFWALHAPAGTPNEMVP